jgi:Ca-activated chloride channel family protein
MSFHHPWLLLLLLLVPPLIYLRYQRGRRAALRFSDGDALGQLPASPALVLQPALPALYAMGLGLLIVALARPQKGLEESRVRAEAVDIVLLVDVSTSMRAEDFASPGHRVNRLDAAKEVMERFIKSRPHDRLGMVAFSALPYSIAPLTLDHAWLLQQMAQRLEIGMLEDGTAIGTGIASAVNRLRDSKAVSKVVVLLTDGINNAGSITPANAAQAAKALGIKIYTVGAGASGLVPVPVQDPFGQTYYVHQRSQIDETSLREIATTTGARFFRAKDYGELKDIYAEIDRMEKTEIEMDAYTRFEDRFQPFLFLSLVCLGLEKMLALSRIGRIP